MGQQQQQLLGLLMSFCRESNSPFVHVHPIVYAGGKCQVKNQIEGNKKKAKGKQFVILPSWFQGTTSCVLSVIYQEACLILFFFYLPVPSKRAFEYIKIGIPPPHLLFVYLQRIIVRGCTNQTRDVTRRTCYLDFQEKSGQEKHCVLIVM